MEPESAVDQKKPGGAMSPPSQPAGEKPRRKHKDAGFKRRPYYRRAEAASAADQKKPRGAMKPDKANDELNDVEAKSSMNQPISKGLRMNPKKQGTDAYPSFDELFELERMRDEMNDVIAGSGVSVRHEGEQLLGGVYLSTEQEKMSGINVEEVTEHALDDTKEESGMSEAEHRFVQEEEKPSFLEIGPLRAKIGAIAAGIGLSSVSEDAERCLSIGAEERLRCMIQKLIRLSKQRWDLEKHEYRVCVRNDPSTAYLIVVAEKKAAIKKQQHELMEKVEREKHEREEKAYERARYDQFCSYNVATRLALGSGDALSRFERIAAHGHAQRQDILLAGSHPSRAGTSDETASSREQERRHEIGDGPAVGGKPRSITLKDLKALLEIDEKLTKSTITYKLLLRD